ncbi:MAG: hypothetical protein INR73_01500 [Williamsia sp.]|nr:hypothetical protein [Williamsia sp.]
MTLKSYFSCLAVFCMMLVLTFLPSLLWAQPGGGGPDPDPSVPLDGGVSLLVAAGVGYAIKKAHDKRKETKMGTQEEK